jgi:hypothetical protein
MRIQRPLEISVSVLAKWSTACALLMNARDFMPPVTCARNGTVSTAATSPAIPSVRASAAGCLRAKMTSHPSTAHVGARITMSVSQPIAIRTPSSTALLVRGRSARSHAT